MFDYLRVINFSIYHYMTLLLSCIECMICILLSPMFLSLSVNLFVCLSRNFTRLWRAKTAKRIEVLFGLKTVGVQGGERVGEIVDPLHILRLTETRDLKFCVLIGAKGPSQRMSGRCHVIYF